MVRRQLQILMQRAVSYTHLSVISVLKSDSSRSTFGREVMVRSLAALGSKNLRIKIGILSDSFSHTVSLPSGNMVAVIKKGYSGLSDWEVQPFSNSGKRIQAVSYTHLVAFC